MTTELRTHDQRSHVAEAAWAALPHGGKDEVRLQVQCEHGHHVAAVYATHVGPVYVAPVRGHSHGSYDLPDEPHHTQEVRHWFDLLETGEGADDALPAWCDCGHRALSRAVLLQWLAAGEHRVVVD